MSEKYFLGWTWGGQSHVRSLEEAPGPGGGRALVIYTDTGAVPEVARANPRVTWNSQGAGDQVMAKGPHLSRGRRSGGLWGWI